MIKVDSGQPHFDPTRQTVSVTWVDDVESREIIDPIDAKNPVSVVEVPVKRALYQVVDRPIEDLRTSYKELVDQAAEACRLRYITPGAGMAMTYQEKFAQAQAVASMGEAAANAMSHADREEQFPTLSASVGLEAPTLWECAQRVLAAYAAFAQLSLVIERTRIAGKQSISAASDGAAVVAAYEALTWPTQ